MSFHNTTNETGATLKEYKGKELSQKEIVLAIFKRENRPLTPSQVLEIYNRETKTIFAAPLTSIRRSITDLTHENRLEKLTTKAIGIYGRNEHFWKLKEIVKPGQQELF